jgi:hypothetical protein
MGRDAHGEYFSTLRLKSFKMREPIAAEWLCRYAYNAAVMDGSRRWLKRTKRES